MNQQNVHVFNEENSAQQQNQIIIKNSKGWQTRLFKSRRQPVSKTVRELMTRLWIRSMVNLSVIAPASMRLAELALGPYKDKRVLLRYLGNRPYISSRAQVSCPNLELGPQCFIDDFVTLYAHPRATGFVHLAENVHLYRWTMVELGDGNGSLTIGANTYLQAGCTLNPFISDITIGKNCMIATRCTFMPYQHSYADATRPMREQPLTSRGDIVIEDNVWLGAQVCVMDGVTIGEGSIVGAGAVVTKDIPPNSLAVGVPARVIRQRNDEKPTSPQLQGLMSSELLHQEKVPGV